MAPDRHDSRPIDPHATEVASAFGDAFARGDRDDFLALMHPEVEIYLPRSALEGGPPYRGLEGAARAWADAFDLWKRFEAELREVSAVGDVFIFAYRVRCFPHREGPPVEYDGHYVTQLRDRKIAYTRPYLDRAAALEAATTADLAVDRELRPR